MKKSEFTPVVLKMVVQTLKKSNFNKYRISLNNATLINADLYNAVFGKVTIP